MNPRGSRLVRCVGLRELWSRSGDPGWAERSVGDTGTCNSIPATGRENLPGLALAGQRFMAFRRKPRASLGLRRLRLDGELWVIDNLENVCCLMTADATRSLAPSQIKWTTPARASGSRSRIFPKFRQKEAFL